jgi:hypothetical protein
LADVPVNPFPFESWLRIVYIFWFQSASGSDGDGGGDVTPLEEVGDCYQEALEEIGVMLGQVRNVNRISSCDRVCDFRPSNDRAQLERLKDEFNTYKDGRMNEILCVLLPC